MGQPFANTNESPLATAREALRGSAAPLQTLLNLEASPNGSQALQRALRAKESHSDAQPPPFIVDEPPRSP